MVASITKIVICKSKLFPNNNNNVCFVNTVMNLEIYRPKRGGPACLADLLRALEKDLSSMGLVDYNDDDDDDGDCDDDDDDDDDKY
jgi:hypothetical protein